MKVGDEYYAAWVDTIDGTLQLDRWVITAIRGDTTYACRKSPHTWVKLSGKTGDYGWAPNLDTYDRRKFKTDALPEDFARSKGAAYSKALPEVEAAIRKLTKLRAQITGQRTKARATSARHRAA